MAFLEELMFLMHFRHHYQSINQNHFISNTNSVHRSHINMEVLEFVKDKPKETNPAIMGNPKKRVQ